MAIKYSSNLQELKESQRLTAIETDVADLKENGTGGSGSGSSALSGDLKDLTYETITGKDVVRRFVDGETYHLKLNDIEVYDGSGSIIYILNYNSSAGSAITSLNWTAVTYDGTSKNALAAYTGSALENHVFYYIDGIGWKRYGGSGYVDVTSEETDLFYFTLVRTAIANEDFLAAVVAETIPEADGIIDSEETPTEITLEDKLSNGKNLPFEEYGNVTGIFDHPNIDLLLKKIYPFNYNTYYIYGQSGTDTITLYSGASSYANINGSGNYSYLQYYNYESDTSYVYYINYEDHLPSNVWLKNSNYEKVESLPALNYNAANVKDAAAFALVYGTYKKIKTVGDEIESNVNTLNKKIETINNTLGSIKYATWDTKWINAVTPVDGKTYSLPMSYDEFPIEEDNELPSPAFLYGELVDGAPDPNGDLIVYNDDALYLMTGGNQYTYYRNGDIWYDANDNEDITSPIQMTLDFSKINDSDYNEYIALIFGFNEHEEKMRADSVLLTKNDSLKNSKYNYSPAGYSFLSVPDWSSIEALSPANGPTQVYSDSNTGWLIGFINMGSGNYGLQVQDQDNGWIIFNHSSAGGGNMPSYDSDTWYQLGPGNSLNTITDPIPTNFALDSDSITDQDILDLVTTSTPEINITLEDAINSVLPPIDTTTNGAYVLKAIVNNGTVTYQWVAES